MRVLLLVLLGCGSPSYYPQTSSFAGADTARPPDEQVPCGRPIAEQPAALSVTSVSNVELALLERDAACDERFIDRLDGQRPVRVDTVSGAVFVVRDPDGAAYDWLEIPFTEGTYAWEVQ